MDLVRLTGSQDRYVITRISNAFRKLTSPIFPVGYNKFDFDSTIETDVLRSLYLVSVA